MRVRVLLLLSTVICFLVTVTPHTLAIPSVQSAYYILMHGISLLWIPKRLPIPFCKPNPEMGSWDYKFLNPGSRD